MASCEVPNQAVACVGPTRRSIEHAIGRVGRCDRRALMNDTAPQPAHTRELWNSTISDKTSLLPAEPGKIEGSRHYFGS